MLGIDLYRACLMKKFAIYYNNGDVVQGGGEDDEEITLTFSKQWLEAPSDGVAVVVSETTTTGRTTLRANEFYYQLPINQHGLGCHGASMKIGAYLRQLGVVKFGGWTDDGNHDEIKRRASMDTYVKRASAQRPPVLEDESD